MANRSLLGTLVGLVGAAIGLYFGGPAGASLGFSLGSLVGGAIFGPEDVANVIGPRLNDLGVASSSYGKGWPIVYGAIRVPGNMLWGKDVIEVQREEEIGRGPKRYIFAGPSKAIKRTVFEYFGQFAMGFSEGPVQSICRVWADSKLIVDVSDVNVVGSGTHKYGRHIYKAYLGTETQLPDPTIEADKGVGQVPAHRGICYMVFNNLPLKDFGNRFPNITAEVVSTITPNNYTKESFNHGGTIDFDNSFASLFEPAIFNYTTERVIKINSLTGDLIWDFDLEPQIPGATILTGSVTASPVTGDVYIGWDGSGAGIAVFDKNGKFIDSKNNGGFVEILSGFEGPH